MISGVKTVCAINEEPRYHFAPTSVQPKGFQHQQLDNLALEFQFNVKIGGRCHTLASKPHLQRLLEEQNTIESTIIFGGKYHEIISIRLC